MLPARAGTETRFVPAALHLAGALDLSAGSCTFEESTCSFESVYAFLPWILNEEGKGPQYPGARGELSSCKRLFHMGNAILELNPPERKSVRHGSSF